MDLKKKFHMKYIISEFLNYYFWRQYLKCWMVVTLWMIGYGPVLRFIFFFGKSWYTNMFTNSYIQVSNTFTIIGPIAESTLKLINDIRSKVFENPVFEMKVVTFSLFLTSNSVCNLKQVKMFFSNFFNIFLVCKDIKQRYGRTKTRDVFLTVRVVSYILSINLLKHWFIKF